MLVLDLIRICGVQATALKEMQVQTGVYSVVVGDEFSCSATDSIFVIINNDIGISRYSQQELII